MCQECRNRPRDGSGSEPLCQTLVAWEQERPRLYRLALHLVGDAEEADDAVQDAAVQVIEHAEEFDPGRPAWPWLRRFVGNACANAGRKRERRQRGEVGFIEGISSGRARSVEREVVRRAQAREVLSAVAALPQVQREVILGHFYEGRSYCEIAAELGCAEATVRARAARGRVALREPVAAAVRLPLRWQVPPAGTRFLQGRRSRRV